MQTMVATSVQRGFNQTDVEGGYTYTTHGWPTKDPSFQDVRIRFRLAKQLRLLRF